MPLNTSYGLKNSGIMFISAMCQKFNLFGSDRRMFVQRSPKEHYSPQCTKSSVKFGGGSVMVFGMISTDGTEPPFKVHGKIYATVCKEMLKKHVSNL